MLGAGSLFPMIVTRLTIGSVLPSAGAYPLVPLGSGHTPGSGPCMTIPLAHWGKSFADDFARTGIVSGRVALLLRSAEIQPLF